jgi:hypothetical protein
VVRKLAFVARLWSHCRRVVDSKSGGRAGMEAAGRPVAWGNAWQGARNSV